MSADEPYAADQLQPDLIVTRLARHVALAPGSAMPGPIRAKAADHALDTLGAMLAGSGADETGLAHAALRAVGERGPVPVVGDPSSGLGPRGAALVNGIAAHAYELDDTGGCDHSGAVIWPALLSLLAVAPEAVPGARVIEAVVMGYDIGRRVMLGFGGYRPHNQAGWHSTGTCGAFAAAAASARLLGLSEAACRDALGIAASMAAGSWAFIHDGAMTKRLHAGHAAEAGVSAALLARQGFKGPAQIFEPVWGGFYQTYGHAGGRAEPALLDGLGERWLIEAAAIKPHASCRDVHGAIDAVARLQARHGPRAEDVRAVQVRLSSFLNGMVGGSDVSTMAAAQMSLPWGIAAQLLWGEAGLSAYSEARRADEAARGLMRRVGIQLDESVQASWSSSLSLELRDGQILEEPTRIPLGAPENPLPAAALRAKFDGLARRVLSSAAADRLADLALGLDGLPDARHLVAAMAGR